MFAVIRSKFGPVVIGGVIGTISIAFVAGDLLRPKATRGLHEGAVAGKVNGDAISISEFNRELNQRLEFFKNLGGGKLSEAQLKAFGIHQTVFNELVSRKLMLQQAKKYGFEPSDEEIREKVSEYPAFQRDGKFDILTYREVLEANHLTPSSYETMVREGLSTQRFQEYFRARSVVSDEEIKHEFLSSHDRRNVKYVVLSHETARKAYSVPSSEIQKVLADKEKTSSLQSRYEIKKNNEYKGKTFDEVKDQIAKEMILSEKLAELDQFNEALSKKIESVMTSDKGSDAKVNALLKEAGVTVQSTGLSAREAINIQGAGKVTELTDAAFKGELAKAKSFKTAAGFAIAVVTETETADLAKLADSRDELIRKLQGQKENELFQTWIEKAREKASIQKNDEVVAGGAEES